MKPKEKIICKDCNNLIIPFNKRHLRCEECAYKIARKRSKEHSKKLKEQAKRLFEEVTVPYTKAKLREQAKQIFADKEFDGVRSTKKFRKLKKKYNV